MFEALECEDSDLTMCDAELFSGLAAERILAAKKPAAKAKGKGSCCDYSGNPEMFEALECEDSDLEMCDAELFSGVAAERILAAKKKAAPKKKKAAAKKPAAKAK